MDARRETPLEAHLRCNEADLLRYFRRRVNNSADAAEAFGELLLIAWRRRRVIPADPERARMWLYATAYNVLRQSRRANARRSQAVQRLADELRTSSATESDAAQDVRDALEGLKPEDAELLRLIYWDDIAPSDAARVLGINPSTLRSRLLRARTRFREVLEANEDSRCASNS